METNHYLMEDALEALIDYRGKTPKKSDSGIPTLSAKSVRNGYIDYSECYFISKDEYRRFMVRGIPKEGDILLTTEAPMGMVARLDRDDVAIAQRLITLRGKKGVLENDYLLYYLQSPIGQHKLSERETGSTVTGIKQAEFRKIGIDIPTVDVQKKIVELLSRFDYIIANNKALNANLTEQAKTIFKEWFINNPDSARWKTGTFSDLIVSTLGGDWGKETETGNYTEQVYCVRGADIPEVNVGNKGKMPIRYILPKNFRTKQLCAGDIVVEISGGSPTQSTGRVASISQSLLDRYDKGMVCTNFCRALKPKHGYSMFVYYYWQYLYDKGVFFLYENGTTGIKNLDIKGFLNSEEISIPPQELVKQFDEVCQAYFSQIFKNGISSEKLSETRDLLLPRLISGELDIADYNL